MGETTSNTSLSTLTSNSPRYNRNVWVVQVFAPPLLHHLTHNGVASSTAGVRSSLCWTGRYLPVLIIAVTSVLYTFHLHSQINHNWPSVNHQPIIHQAVYLCLQYFMGWKLPIPATTSLSPWDPWATSLGCEAFHTILVMGAWTLCPSLHFERCDRAPSVGSAAMDWYRARASSRALVDAWGALRFWS